MGKNTNHKPTRDDRRRAIADYERAQDALDKFRGDPESDEFHRLNDASHAAKQRVGFLRRHRWI